MSACPICYANEPDDYCRTTPACVDCEDGHGGCPGGRCRDCDITHRLDSMQCSGCNRMRYRSDDATGPLAGLGQALWGERCTCDPRPPSVAELPRE